MQRFLVPNTTLSNKPVAASGSSNVGCGPVPSSLVSSSNMNVPTSQPNEDSVSSVDPAADTIMHELNNSAPSQPILKVYPKRTFSQGFRSFNSNWYQSRPWLEYSVNLDACFCFPCRQFAGVNNKDVVFTKTGYCNWKAALEKGKGFQKHEASHSHVSAAIRWTEMKRREESGGDTISDLLGQTQVEDNRYYIKSIGQVVQFLCVNELGFRGSTESTQCRSGSKDDISAGLFLNLFEYTLSKDSKLAEIAKTIPQNAKYISKNIQNEIIDTLASLVLQEMKTKDQKAGINSDGPQDRPNIDNQLHLAVVHAIQGEPCAKNFFDLSGLLHSFFHHHYVAQNYNTPPLKRLLGSRWTSHYDVTQCLVENQEVILNILSDVCANSAATMAICTEAAGLLVQLRRHNFFAVGKFLEKILSVLIPVNAELQSQTVDLCHAEEVISASLEALKDIRKDGSWEDADYSETTDNAPPAKRKRTMNRQRMGSIVLSTLGQSDTDSLSNSQAMRRSLLNVLDRVIGEMEDRFSKQRLELMRAVNCLLPQSDSFLDMDLLAPLQLLSDASVDTLQHEVPVAKAMLLKTFSSDNVDLSTVCEHVQMYKEVFPNLHTMYVTALEMDVASAATLSRVLTPFRSTMTHDRKSNLVVLAREKSITKAIDMDEFVREFAKKSRRLAL
ncbi:hypothetical protein ACEWY4_027025 [Coilia grayii]|uniref:TTF-type domain-containing protein n=1 Tax=Coilia grayii TaxID=363190 RepID=A0ABD1ITI4_9TELE